LKTFGVPHKSSRHASSINQTIAKSKGGHRWLVLIATLSLALLTGSLNANAQVVNIASQLGLEGLGVFTGSLNYSFSSATAATLIVNITNSNATAAGGKLTAIAFNNPGNKITGVTVSSTLSTMKTRLGHSAYNNNISASPWGSFDIGVGVGSSWLSGGSPNGGIQRGNSATFTFNLTGTGLNTLTTNSFITTTNSTGQFFAARFRGFNNGGSDKVAGIIPEPAFYQMSALLLLGGTGMMMARRCKKGA
jgi:hypothetical protein